MFEIIIITALVISIILNIAAGILIRGMTFHRQDELGKIEPRAMTGYEIEGIRRQLIHTGRQDLTLGAALSLIKTLQDIQLGTYEDTNPFVPADIYEEFR